MNRRRRKPDIEKQLVLKSGRWSVTMLRALEDDRKQTEYREDREQVARMSPEKRREWLREMQRLDTRNAKAAKLVVPLTKRFHPREDLDV